jgi:peptidyl-prolyl isomerase H (cyclophilin H)
MALHSPLPLIHDVITRGNVAAFMDIDIGGRPFGRMMFELFKDKCPKTVENFRSFCTGEVKRSAQPVGYKGCSFHRVIKGFMIQGGDFVSGDGMGSFSIYGSSFADENFDLSHDSAGLLSMANSGVNSNGCQFFITCDTCQHLDGKHVVFGKLLGDTSMVIMRAIEAVSVQEDKPTVPVTISNCGEL